MKDLASTQTGFAAVGSLTEKICERIEKDIRDLHLRPDEVVNSRALAETYGVSRTTVRSALNVLESKGVLLKSESGKFLVPALNYEELIDMLVARDLCEHHAALLQCEVAAQADIDRFYSLALGIKDRIRNGEYRQAVIVEKDFHKSIVDTCGNQFIVSMYNSIFPSVGKYISYAEFALAKTSEVKFPDTVSNAHLMIVDAISSRMPENIDAAMKIHSEAITRVLLYPGDKLYFDN